MLINGSVFCPGWLYSRDWTNSTTLDDINSIFLVRNIPGIVFVSTLMVTGIIGNALVLYIFGLKYSYSNYRTYVLCLAVIDQISSVLVMPFIIVYLLFPKTFPGNILCKFGHFVGYYTSVASAFLLILIAVDRYRKICQPLKRQISKKIAIRSCIIINIVALVISIQSFIIYGTTKRSTRLFGIQETICFFDTNMPLAVTLGQVFYIQLQVCLAIVILFLTVLYFRIMRKLTCHRQESMRRLSRQISGPRIVRTRKTTITFIVITLVFAVSSEIHHALAMILHFVENLECHMNKSEGRLFYVFLWAVFINNVSNPFIYGVSDERFRKHIKRIVARPEDRGISSIRRKNSNSSNTD